jgi:peptidoglycan-N-acetylglucosamine deacetylase
MRDRPSATKHGNRSGRGSTVVFVTTSWDDGHVLDHKVAAMMRRHGLRGTFYVAPQNVELPLKERLRQSEIAALSQEYEIGGHTLTHQRLTRLPDAEARREVTDGKDALEQIVGAPLRSFCYPGGKYDRQHPDMVRDAGFDVGRTVRRGVTAWSPPLETHTTVHAYRHLRDGVSALRLARGHVTKATEMYGNWDALAKVMFDRVLRDGGIFHLWGHSWEIDRNGDWDRLERVLRYIGGRPEVSYIDNGDLASVRP